MDSILRQINQNNGNKSRKELMELYLNSIDEELNKMYQNMDCVDNYRQNYIKFRQNSRQYYQCVHNSCHFSTNKSSLIVRHIRRHLKLKPYCCPINGCKHNFYQKCDLRCHLMRHFEDKPFVCSHQNCDKSYTTRKALSLHLKSHLPFGFNCNECKKTFPTNWKLNKHTKERHNQSIVNTSPKVDTQSKPIVRIDPNIESKVKSKGKLKVVPKVETKVEPKVEPKVESKSESNVEAKVELKVKSKTESKVETTLQIKVEPKVETKIKRKVEPNANPLIKQKPKVESNFKPKERPNIEVLMNRLIQSIDSINERFREELLSKDNIKSFSTELGFEEAIKYLVNRCTHSSKGLTTLTTQMTSVRPLSGRVDSSLKTIGSDSTQLENSLFPKYVRNICSLIEVYRLESLDPNKKFLYKCFNCIYTSDSVHGIVGHVLEHISDGLTQTLRNKSVETVL